LATRAANRKWFNHFFFSLDGSTKVVMIDALSSAHFLRRPDDSKLPEKRPSDSRSASAHSREGARYVLNDDTALRRAATKFLNSLAGVEVVTHATSATEALARAAALRPDLVLMDVVMPGVNGLKAVSLVKQGVDAPKTVVLTLHDTEAYRSAAKTAGADGFIAKDDFVVELPPLLESLFPGRRR
jgi:CheY-like chemotaxis protein